ncbi:hypothetical protein GQR58_016573 [Nymphon striatum]|nr:hypothetical protein GQR58_016573 [Nymphon striatum]
MNTANSSSRRKHETAGKGKVKKNNPFCAIHNLFGSKLPDKSAFLYNVAHLPFGHPYTRWYGHVIKKEDSSLWKLAPEFGITGRRPRGRPRKKWNEDELAQVQDLSCGVPPYCVQHCFHCVHCSFDKSVSIVYLRHLTWERKKECGILPFAVLNAFNRKQATYQSKTIRQDAKIGQYRQTESDAKSTAEHEANG